VHLLPAFPRTSSYVNHPLNPCQNPVATGAQQPTHLTQTTRTTHHARTACRLCRRVLVLLRPWDCVLLEAGGGRVRQGGVHHAAVPPGRPHLGDRWGSAPAPAVGNGWGTV